MTKRLTITALEVLSLGILAICVVLFSYPFFFYALDGNFREIVTYNQDSASILRDIRDALNSPRFQLNFTGYGQLFFNICIALGFLYSCVAHLGEHELFFIIRLVTWLGGVFSIALTYIFVRRFVGRIEAIYAAAALTGFPIVILMFVDPHPDTWQMFFVILSLYYCARTVEAIGSGIDSDSENFRLRPDVAFVLKASAAAGAAFSTKYVGAFFLPLLVLLAVSLPPIAIGARRFEAIIRWSGFACALLAVPLIILFARVKPEFLLDHLPEWRSLPENAVRHIAVIVRWSALMLGIFYLGVAAAITAGNRFLAHKKWFTRLSLLVSVGFMFAVAFALTSPWAVYRLRFFPDVYGMSVYISFGHGTKAPWGGPHWFKMIVDGMGLITFILSLVGAVGIVGSLFGGRKDRQKLLPLLVVLGWVVLFGGYLLLRVNLVHQQYAMPLIAGIVVLSAAGLMVLRTIVGSVAEKPAFAGAVLIAVAGLSLQFFQNTGVYAAARREGLTTSLTPDNQIIGQWYSRCIPKDARIFPAPYTYIPPEISEVWFRTQGYDALMQFKPNLIMVEIANAKMFMETPELTSASVQGTADDTSRFYKIVLQSTDYVAGPQFGGNRVYLTPDLAKVLAERSAECLLPEK
jgi:4-amino-4-deoxy-L-arabinose transferase-like glycosyltransferase